jgi:hypothetical protein
MKRGRKIEVVLSNNDTIYCLERPFAAEIDTADMNDREDARNFRLLQARQEMSLEHSREIEVRQPIDDVTSGPIRPSSGRNG